MQTFLPYPSFTRSAACLDRARLGKQRVEAWQILQALEHGGAWVNHPAVRMWAGRSVAVAHYALAMCDEWDRRGYCDTMTPRFTAIVTSGADYISPWWLGHPAFHASHRSNLLRKDPSYYGTFGWTESPDLPYWWPTEHLEELAL